MEDHLTNILESYHGDTETAIAEIKRAFIDAGWFLPADTEFVQQIINQRAQQRVDAIKKAAGIE